MSLQQLQDFSPEFGPDIYENIDLKACVKAKKSEGSTSFEKCKEDAEERGKLIRESLDRQE